MAGRGVLFAITDDDVQALEQRRGSEDIVDYVAEVIEERWEDGYVCELDKSWDALHRALTDGTLDAGAGTFPLNAGVLGREVLHADDDYFIGLTRVADVSFVAQAVADVSETSLTEGYGKIEATDYGPEYGPEDLDYLLGWFADVAAFWKRAAVAGRSVIFTVDA